jgi:four helix bundle protein
MAHAVLPQSSMNEKAEALKARTKKFALDVLGFVDTFPTYGPAVRIGNQLAAAATSVAANYRASCRARSRAEFAAKIGLVLEESDESAFWLEVAESRQLGRIEMRQQLTKEAGELTAIFAQSSITARAASDTTGR